MSETRSALTPDRIGGAAGWRFAYLGIQGGASVVLFGALAHVLAKREFAAAAIAQGVLVIAQALGDFGLSQAAVTTLPARIARAPDRAASLLAGAARAFAFAAAAAVVLTFCAVVLVPGAAMLPVALIAPAAGATVLVAGADGILRAQGEFRRPVILVAASRAAAFAGVPVAIATHSATWTCAAISAGTTIGAIGAALTLRRARGLSSTPATREFARATVPLGLSQLFVVIGTRADTLLAGALSGLVAAATFEGTWRIYQIGQYAIGGFVTAAAPFIADALGGGRHDELRQLVRRIVVRLVVGGIAVGGVIYLAREPIAQLLAGSLSAPVARALPVIALLSPLAVAGLLALYTLVAHEGQRKFVLFAYGIGAVVNVAVASVLAGQLGGRGVVIGCVAGLTITNVLLLVRFALLLRTLDGPDLVIARSGAPGLAERPG